MGNRLETLEAEAMKLTSGERAPVAEGNVFSENQRRRVNWPPSAFKLAASSIKTPLARLNLDSSVGRPQARRQRLNRVRSAVTPKVKLINAEIVNVHRDLLKEISGQLRNLG